MGHQYLFFYIDVEQIVDYYKSNKNLNFVQKMDVLDTREIEDENHKEHSFELEQKQRIKKIIEFEKAYEEHM